LFWISSAEYVELFGKFKYFGTVLTDQNYIYKEIKSRLDSGSTTFYAGIAQLVYGLAAGWMV